MNDSITNRYRLLRRRKKSLTYHIVSVVIAGIVGIQLGLIVLDWIQPGAAENLITTFKGLPK